MFLKTLKIENGNAIVRNIKFRKGINLVVDETTSSDRKESGNNVGKTTVLRLVDFCLGSSGKNIYQDPEFKNKTNLEIERFLKNNDVFITLVLKDDLEIETSREIKIRRNFKSRSEKVIELNDEPIKSKDFPEILKKEIFGSNVDKPTFRQIISKNVRDEKSRLIHTVKVLHPTTTPQEYESLYLYWLGIEIDVSDRKQKLFLKKKIEQNLQTRLKKENSLSQIKQSLLVVDSEIHELENMKARFNINENYKAEVSELNYVKRTINRLSTQISRLNMRKALIEESASELKSETSTLSSEKIKVLYGEAKSLIPSLQKTFEETLAFHNGMVQEKLKYITLELPEIETELSELETKLGQTLSEEEQLTTKLNSSSDVEDFQKLIRDLNQSYSNKGALEEQQRLWTSSLDALKEIKTEIEQIDQGIHSKDDLIQRRVSEFNKFFSKLSDELYGEKFVLAADPGEKGYELSISSIISNPGTGKKKGEMAAFDLSYIQFADALGIDCLHFVLQDQIENIHDNQITSILTTLIEQHNCQYILPVLRDKLPIDLDTSKFEVISLSQEQRLFKV